MKILSEAMEFLATVLLFVLNTVFVASVYLIVVAAWFVSIKWAWNVIVETFS